MNDKPSQFFSGGSSCINIVFCKKPDKVSKYGVYYSFFRTGYHNLANIITKYFVYSRSGREAWAQRNRYAGGMHFLV